MQQLALTRLYLVTYGQGVQTCSPKRLICIDITNPGYQRLVKKQRLKRSLLLLEYHSQRPWSEL
jgi:hypothetical protein